MRAAHPIHRHRGRALLVAALVIILGSGATATAWAVGRTPHDRVTGVATPATASVAAVSSITSTSTSTSTLRPSMTNAKATMKQAKKQAQKRVGHPTTSTTVTARAVRPAAGQVAAAATSAASSATTVGRLFAASSPWNRAIPAGAALDPQSTRISRSVLTNPSLVVNLAIYAYGIPFYTATSSTPRVVLRGRGSTGAKIPLDPSWAPNVGGDRKMNVIDPATRSVFELQYYDRAARSAYWMVQRNIATGSGDGTASNGRTGPTGSGMSQAGGVIRISELKSGRIDHALSFITSAPVASRHRYPATSTDGTSRASVGMEEGMRIQLDPGLNLGSLHLSKAESAIARAMQVYGAYCVDNGGGNNQAMGFYAEQPTKATGDPYASVGLTGDWAQLRGIPRSAYRVLAASVTRP